MKKVYGVLLGLMSACTLSANTETYGVSVAHPINGGPSCHVHLQKKIENQKTYDIFTSDCDSLGYQTKFYSKKYKSEKTAKRYCTKNFRCKATVEVKPGVAYMLCRGKCNG